MDAPTVSGLLRLLELNAIEVYVDGGWAVDAVLGIQTRPHDDLDIAMPHAHVPALRQLLATRGFRDHPRPDTRECNFVLADQHGNRLDVHSYTLDLAGNNIFGIPYQRADLTGHGIIGEYPVHCICPESLVRFHTGYEPDDNDRHDIRLLCERFAIPLPAAYL